MHFCEICQNMYYIAIDSETQNNLIYYCRNCGNRDDNANSSILSNPDNIFILKSILKKSEQEFSHIINQYTKLDPTLPRVNNILCPNDECPTNINPNDNSREIIYIRYDDKNMKYVSLCSTCDTVWKMEENK